jgi:hypothetical protein
MTRHREPSPALATYVDALVGIGGQLTTILYHMREHRSADVERDPAETIACLIADVMPPRLARRDVDLEVAARLIKSTAEAIEDNIFLVADDDPPVDPTALNGNARLH